MKISHTRAVFLMVGVALMWSTAGVVVRHLESARSFEVTFWRSLFTALSLLIILPVLRGRKVYSNLRLADKILWASGVCWSIMFTAFMVALTLTTVANVLITLALGPLFTALIARVFMGHHIALRTWVAIAVAGGGIASMYGAQVSSQDLMGTWIAVCVPVAGAINWTLTQRAHTQGHDVDLVPAVFLGAVISSLLTLPLAWPIQATPHDLLLLAFLGVGQLAIPCVLAVLCAQVLKAPEISLLALLEVVFGIALAWLGAGEKPALNVLVGGFLVIAALVANEALSWKQRKLSS
jgi:drug/metabolite transporter (DMT)-like permease